MKFGKFEINAFVEQKFRLDGGMMFGVVPKVIWNKLAPADDKNFIPMSCNLYVLKAHGKTMLFETGLGDTLNEREKVVYNTDAVTAMEKGLWEQSLMPDDIDYVILTHLHTDHAGGVASFDKGEFVPRFKNAKYLASKDDWDAAMHPNERTGAVYHPQRLNAIKDAGQLELIDSDSELFPGIKAVYTGGHTEGHFALEMESDGKKVWYYADIFPTASHMSIPYIAATDVRPLESMDVKRKVLPRILEEDVILAFDHDPYITFGKLSMDGKRFKVTPVSGI